MICIYHSRDLDGWCSAAIVMKWYKETNPNGVIYDNPYQGDKSIVSGKEKEESLTMFGWDYGNELPNLNRYKKVIMVDISFPKEEMSKLYHMLDVSFIWIDHHISAIKENDDLAYDGLRDTKHAACELTWKHFFPNENMPEFVRLLGRYDCFGHKGTDEEENVLLFQYAARAKYFDFKSCYEGIMDDIRQSYFTDRMLDSGKSIYKYLCTEARQTYQRRFTVDFDGYKFAVVNAPRFNPINFGIKYHEDKADDVYYYDGACCFHYEKGKWMFSLYNDNGQLDVSEIAKRRGGGGHKGAAGFVINKLDEILKFR